LERISTIRRRRLLPEKPYGNLLSYLHAGDPNGQQVIFVHGTPGSAEGWADFLLNVPVGIEYVALDRPGFGQSSSDKAEISISFQAAAVERLLAVRSGRKPVLVGHSLGGAIVAWLAAAKPDLVSAIVIAAGSLDPEQERLHPLQPWGEKWPIRQMLPKAVRNANLELMGLKPWLERLQPMLSRIRVPVWIVHGTGDDLVPYANVDFMLRNMTRAAQLTVDRLEGANHFLPWNSKPRIERVISHLAGRQVQ
jgi:pimeloyl-ACP methyl ester carboxylesterase